MITSKVIKGISQRSALYYFARQNKRKESLTDDKKSFVRLFIYNFISERCERMKVRSCDYRGIAKDRDRICRQ